MADPTVEYEWRSYWDDVQERRVSDWERAEQCARCGAAIVHVYHVAGELVGRECAHLALGWRRRMPRRLKALVRAHERRQEEAQSFVRMSERGAVESAAEAVAECRARNGRYAGLVSVWQRSGLHYALPAACTRHGEALSRAGWRVLA